MYALKFPEEGTYKGLIFDLDGTLVDSMPTHFKAWSKALEEHGSPGIFPEDVFYSMGGKPTKDIVRELNRKMNLTLDPDAVSHSKREVFLHLMGEIEIIAPVIDYVKAHYGRVPMAVATGGTRAIAEKTLKILELDGYFQSVLTADDVKCGKPAPEVFLLAAESIGISPEDCVAFEDAAPGIMAAQSAGMKVITVPAPQKKER